MLVAVKVDEEWCRAQVIFKLGTVADTEAGSDFLVKLVDLGRVEVVNLRHIRVLEKCFPALPAQVGTAHALTSSSPHQATDNHNNVTL